DEAHGAHFAFHPQLPTPALRLGADLTVQSIHKVLGALTQASMLHIQGNKINSDRISKALQLLQSTSPSYLLLASLDAARQQMAVYGKELMRHSLELAEEARNRISQIPGLSVFDLASKGSGSVTLDRTRLTVTVSELGLSGFEADEILNDKLGVTAEYPSQRHLTFIISLGNTQQDIEQLVQAFTTLAKDYRTTPSPAFNSSGLTLKPPMWDDSFCKIGNYDHISPREAFFAETETLELQSASDRICAEIVCPYPPGIPVLMPGEVINKVTLEYLQYIQNSGAFISGCADSSLKTLKVVK
ncbi:aminotransferase class I/II-fold pyridoxal phosphate-dependent enzyme, partial [Aetokthonos hydrillicola]|nr:arginine decarboxylase [Aetokthonos hydrillicola CCALA 1050]